MESEFDWTAITKDALSKLGGNEVAVAGAKLRSEAERLAGRSLSPHLDSQGKTFSQFLDEIPGIDTHKRRGTDMAVGFEGATVPIPGGVLSQQEEAPLRPDVYAALTQVTQTPYAYVPGTDEFTQDPAEDTEAVRLPTVTLDDLITERLAFAEGITDTEQRPRLLAAVQRSANPLADFRRSVSELGLGRSWYRFKLERLKEKLARWAEDRNLEVRPSWFARQVGTVDGSPQEILAELAKHMTEEEIRSLMVPFGAVEGLYRAAGRRRRP